MKILAILCVMLGIMNVYQYGLRMHDKAAFQAYQQAQTLATAKAEESARAEEARRIEANKEIAHVAQIAQDRAQDDRNALDARISQLRSTIAREREAAAHSTVAASCPSDPIATMYAKLFVEAVGESQRLAAEADASRIAGQACEQSYDSLTTNPQTPPSADPKDD